MSVSAPPQPSTGAPARDSAAAAGARPATDACPLCGTPLLAEQDWCLRCGAAARTRLASSPNWRLPVAVVAVAGALALGLLVVALVKLAGGSSSSHRPAAAGLRSTPAAQSGAPTGAGGAGLGSRSTPATVPGAATGTPGAAGSVPSPATGGGVARGAPGSSSTGASPAAPAAPSSRAGIPPTSTSGATSAIPSRAEQERVKRLLRKTR